MVGNWKIYLKFSRNPTTISSLSGARFIIKKSNDSNNGEMIWCDKCNRIKPFHPQVVLDYCIEKFYHYVRKIFYMVLPNINVKQEMQKIASRRVFLKLILHIILILARFLLFGMIGQSLIKMVIKFHVKYCCSWKYMNLNYH